MDTTLEPLDAETFAALSDRQRRAIPVVVAAPTLKSGLDAAEVPRSTWQRWQREDEFAQAFLVCHREVFHEALHDLQTGVRYASNGLLGLLTSKDERIRLQACTTVVTIAMRTAELLDIEDRMARLEDALHPLIEAAEL